MDIMDRALQTVLFVYLLAASFTHPWLPGYPLLGAERALSFVIYLRELMLIVLVVLSIISIRNKKNTIILYIFILYSIIISTITAATTSLSIIISIRSIITISAVIVIPIAARKSPGMVEVSCMALKIIIPIYLIISIIQIFMIPPYYGETFFGPRVFSSTASPLNLSYIAGASAILFATQREPRKFWVYACCALTVISGGRTGMMISLIALCALAGRRFKADLLSKILGMIILLAITVFASLIVSSPEISGRAGTAGGPLQDARFGVWWEAIYPWLDGSWREFLFGLGIGLGSNASRATAVNFSYTDSAFVYLLISYGLVGFTLISVSIMLAIVSNLSIFAVLAFLLTAATQLIFELQPTFIILILSLQPRFRVPQDQVRIADFGRRRRFPRVVWSRSS
jgi:hypothetical protein